MLAIHPEWMLAILRASVPEGWQNSLLEILLARLPATRYGHGMIIVIANSKGGVGKSTLAVHLAAWLSQQGHRVTLADCDTQQSSSEWIREAAPDVKAVRLDNPDIILDQLPLLDQDTDFVVADGPGSQSDTSRALLLRADLAVVPCKASMLEIRALAKATDVLRQAQDIRKGAPRALIVLSMVGKNYRLTKDMTDAAAGLKLPLAKTALILRQIYADAPGQGKVVWQLGARGREAAEEVKLVFRELLPQHTRARVSSKARSNLA
ncbi:MAG: ParA family protein [Planctomycetaceae bacterium]|nr:ParA family protein [Planctomycetaceae bacterium]